VGRQTSEFNRAQLLPRTPREALAAVMATVADGDTSAACFLFTDPARAPQLAAAWGASDCPGCGGGLALQVTRPADYTTSVVLVGVTPHHDQSGPRERHRHRLRPDLGLPIDSLHPAAGPTSPGRMALRRVLGRGLPDHRLPALLTPPRPAAR